MATLLVCYRDKPFLFNHPKPHVLPKAGDVISVRPDGWVWGKAESLEAWLADGGLADDYPGLTCVVDLPGIDPAKLEPLLNQNLDTSVLERRVWKIDLALLRVPQQRAFFDAGRVSITANDMNGSARHKVDGAARLTV